jgi:hypothetical protein
MFKSIASHPTCRRDVLKVTGVAGVIASMLPASQIGLAIETHEDVARAAPELPPRSEMTSQTAAMLRDLWIGHIFWVRSVSLAAIENNDAAMEAAQQQAAINAQAIAASIEPFHGSTAKEEFHRLLVDHYRSVKTYLAGIMSSSMSIQTAATQSIASNAGEIAACLSKANPYLPADELQGLLLAHGGHHLQQIQELMARNFMAEAETWEIMKAHVYDIADMTADALAKQFPKRFLAGPSG